MECVNCGHSEDEHKWSERLARTICSGDGFFENTDPQCDCDMFEEEEDYEEVE